MTATPLDRVAFQLRAAQDASDKLNAFLAKRADAGHFIRKIADDLSASLALAEASLMAARPALNAHEITITNNTSERPSTGPLWLDLTGWTKP